ncbi:MAG: 30S ribosomal protein S16 [Mollicutes bacterium]|nr:MAG: 30S ribosomal protein S16 [Mollicutes bacterium]
MVKLRLRRTGKTHIPSYQIVAIHSQKARNAMYLEKVGHYYPLDNKYDLDAEKALK